MSSDGLYPLPTLAADRAVFLSDATVDCPDCVAPMVMVFMCYDDRGMVGWMEWECRSCGAEIGCHR